jgi:16S rRNA processing protein RimM
MEPTAGSRSSIDPKAVALGRVVGAHGLRGAIRVRYFAEGPENLLAVKRVALGRSEADGEALAFDVGAVAPGRPGELRMELIGLRGRDAALALKGRLVLVAPGELATLPAGEYYGYQLLGCRVEDEAGTALGVVREIWETGPSDVLVVEDEGRRHLVPAAFLRRLDAAERRIVVEIPPGLIGAE